jgi:hypothetical protein
MRGFNDNSALRQTQVPYSKTYYPNIQHPYPEDGSLGVVAGQKAGGEGHSPAKSHAGVYRTLSEWISQPEGIFLMVIKLGVTTGPS